MTWWEEFSVKWDVMLHRGVPVPQAELYSTPGLHWLLPASQPLPLPLSFFFSLSHFLSLSSPGDKLQFLFITCIFLWLSSLWIKNSEPCWEFAALNYCVVINEVWAPTLQSSSCWSPPERLVPYQRHCCSPTSVSSSAVVSLHLQLYAIYESLIETDSLIFHPNCPGIWQNRERQRQETDKTKWKRMSGRWGKRLRKLH